TLYALSVADRERAIAHASRLLGGHADKPLLKRGLSGLLGIAPDHSQDSEYARAVFDQFADSFNSTLASLGYLDMPRTLANALCLRPEDPPLDILDAGCGTGLCGPLLKPAARSLIGVDLSPKMLDKARALSIYDRLVTVDAVAFMAENPDAFDVVV